MSDQQAAQGDDRNYGNRKAGQFQGAGAASGFFPRGSKQKMVCFVDIHGSKCKCREIAIYCACSKL